MKKIIVVVLIFALVVLGFAATKYYKNNDYGNRPVISNFLNHNEQMNACVKAALERHPGAVVETEVEIEDGKLITDVDIQGADAKNWEVECELSTTRLVEDKLED
jgi:uncharacterized membrane protein YkoI